MMPLNMRDEAVKRIAEMEACFDMLLAAAERAPDSLREDGLRRQLQKLTDYYENGQWMEDFVLDAQGKLPAGLKRGVLSEDGVYNLLSDLDMWLQEAQHEVTICSEK